MATITETVRRPKVRHTQCFIDGKWQDAASGKTFQTIDPSNEEVIADVAEGDAADVDRAAKARVAHSTQDPGAEWMREIAVD